MNLITSIVSVTDQNDAASLMPLVTTSNLLDDTH